MSQWPEPERPEAGLIPGVYKHFRGNLYRLLFVAKHSETLEAMVVYQALYGEGGYWVRPAAMWNERVLHDGKMQPRFAWHEMSSE